MDFQRLFLFVIFSFSLIMVWDGWQRYQHPELEKPVAVIKSDLPAPAAVITDVTQNAVIQQTTKIETGKIIKVKTDFLEADINTVGGDIQHLDFLKHPDGQDKTKNFVLFEKGNGTHNYVAQSGLLG